MAAGEFPSPLKLGRSARVEAKDVEVYCAQPRARRIYLTDTTEGSRGQVLFQHKRKGEESRRWSARVRLDGGLKQKTVPLHISDKRVAEQKLAQLIEELEREVAGIGTPKVQKDAAPAQSARRRAGSRGRLCGTIPTRALRRRNRTPTPSRARASRRGVSTMLYTGLRRSELVV